MQLLRLRAIPLVFFALSAILAHAQVNNGSIGGSVLDPGGAAVPGASVAAVNQGSGQTFQTQSSDAGLYVFPSLPTGIYEITAEQAGFKKLTQGGLEVRVAQRLALDLTLEIGAVTETVEVTAAPPLLEATTSERGQSFSPKFMSTLPLFTGGIRNPEAFVSYMPGVTTGGGNQSINGSGGRSKEVLIDGASLTIPESGGVVFNFPAAEMFGEFKLITDTYSAEHGRFGGGVETFVSKSGNNEFHGTGFWNFRRDALDAAGWALNRSGQAKARQRLNEIGFGVGGPVIKNKTFFFFTYSADKRPATGAPVVSSVATARMKAGDFGEHTRLIYDPLTTAGNARNPFPNNAIPQSRFDSVSRGILAAIPDPNLSAINNNYSFVNFSTRDDYHYSIKLDHSFSDNNRLAYFQSMINQDVQSITALPGPLGQGLGSSFQKPIYYRLNHDYIVSPSFLIHTTYGFSKTRQGWDNPDQAGFASRIGLNVDTDATPRIQFEAADVLTAFGVQDGKVANGFQNNTTYHVTQAMSWLKGKHELKFGWDFRHLRTTAQDAAGTNGLFSFARAQTALPSNTGGTGHSFASFLLGLPNSASTAALPIPDVQIRYQYHSGYIQDNWKLTNRLTLNLGARYEVPIGFHFANDQFSSVDLTIPNPAAGGLPGVLTFAGSGAGRIGEKRFYPTDFSNFGPRAGFAYRIGDKTVLRGGYGVFFQALGNGGCGCTLGFAGPPTQIQSDGINGAFQFSGGIPVPPNLASPPFIDPTFGNGRDVDYLGPQYGNAPRYQNWSINLQRTIGPFLVDLAYVGNRGTGLNSSIWLNQVDPKYLTLGSLLRQNINSPEVQAAGFSAPYEGFTGTLAQSLRPYPQFLNVTSRNSGDGKTWYDAFQAKLERRFGGWQMMTSYTYSKSQASLHFRQIFTQFEVTPQNSYDLSAEKYLSPSDQPHVVNILNSFDLPFGKGKRWMNKGGVANAIVGGWTIAAAQRYYSGNLSNTNVANSLSNALFNGSKRAYTTGQPLRTSFDRDDLDPSNTNTYFNPGAFALPGEFNFGTASLYLTGFRQPKVLQENVSLLKQFALIPLGEREVRATLRADFFNFLNRNDFNVNMAIGNPAFGRATGPNQGPRFISLGMRVDF